MSADKGNKAQRVAKWIARAGICSRREAERYIEQGRVAVAGEVITTPAITVEDPATISVDGTALADVSQTRLWCYYKPTGLVTTHKDPEGRPTVFESLPSSLPRVISVGRLDQYSEGLLLLTNDGDLARKLEHPETGLRRTYRVQVFGPIDKLDIEKLKRGISIEGQRYRPVEVKVLSQKKLRAWVQFILVEGKNREIRNIVEHFGLKVLKLIRESYGPYELGELKSGDVREVCPDE